MILVAVIAVVAIAVMGVMISRQPAPQPQPQPGPAPVVDNNGPPPAPTPAPSPAPTPGPAAQAKLGDFVLPQSSVQPLSPAAVAGLDKAQLRIARNEIYARHGRIFKSPDLAAHFAQFAWYKPVAAEVDLSPVEQANVDLLQQAESSR